MPNENEVIAVFKADIEQYKAQMAQLGIVNKEATTTTDTVTAATDTFTKKTKSSASAIRTLGQGLGGITGLLALTGRLIGVDTQKLQELIFASQQFVSVSKKVVDAQKLSNAASAASIPILGAIIGVVGAVAAVLIRYQDQIFGVTEAQKEKTKADDGAIITDEKLRASYNESLKTIRDLGIEYRLITGQINEYQASLENLRNKNADDIKQIKSDTKVQIDEIVGFWGEVRLAVAKGLGLENLEAKKIMDELSAAITDRNTMLKLKGEELTETEKLALAKRFKEIDEDTKRRLKLDQDRIDKEKATRKKAAADELAELREFQKERNEANQQGYDDNQSMIRRQGEAARDQLEKEEAEIREFNLKSDELTREVLRDQAKKNKDEQDKIDQERIESAKQVLDTIFEFQQRAYDQKQALLDKEIDNQDKNIERQQRLAERGLENTLAFEEKRAADLQRQQQKDAEKQKKIKLLETFLNALAEYSKSDPDTALQKALLQVALATAATAIFAEEGGVIGEIGERSNGTRKHRGGGDVLLHAQTGEGILPRDAMTAIGRRNFELLKNAGRHPVRDDIFGMPQLPSHIAGGSSISNAEVVKELKALQHIVKNKRETHWEVNKFGEYVQTAIENGITTIRKGKMKKPRL